MDNRAAKSDGVQTTIASKNLLAGGYRVGRTLIVFLSGIFFFGQGCLDEETFEFNAATVRNHDLAATFDERRSFNLGEVMQGERICHTFGIRNTTGKPFTIVAIKKSCGCERVQLSEGTSVPAGSILKVPYSMNSHTPGKQKGQLIITTDAIEEAFRKITFTLYASVQAQMSAVPSRLVFSVGENGRMQEQEFLVKSIIPGQLESFREVRTSRGLVDVELKASTPQALIFKASVPPNRLRDARADLISIRFDNTDLPYLNIIVRLRSANSFVPIPNI